jgi:integrase
LRHLWEEFHADRQHTRKATTLKGYRLVMESVFAGKAVKRRRAVYENWMDRPAQSIGELEVFDLHRRLGKESGKAYANAAMRVLSSVMSFGVTRGRLKLNPVDRLRREWFPVKPRKTVIPHDKLPDWFKAVDSLRFDPNNIAARVGGDYLEFVLHTGLRREEAAGLTWNRVDLEKRTFTITDTKNTDPLTLPLSPHLASLLERRKGDAGDSRWVFPSPGRKGKPHTTRGSPAGGFRRSGSRVAGHPSCGSTSWIGSGPAKRWYPAGCSPRPGSRFSSAQQVKPSLSLRGLSTTFSPSRRSRLKANCPAHEVTTFRQAASHSARLGPGCAPIGRSHRATLPTLCGKPSGLTRTKSGRPVASVFFRTIRRGVENSEEASGVNLWPVSVPLRNSSRTPFVSPQTHWTWRMLLSRRRTSKQLRLGKYSVCVCIEVNPSSRPESKTLWLYR